jgi:hypothetical protein
MSPLSDRATGRSRCADRRRACRRGTAKAERDVARRPVVHAGGCLPAADLPNVAFAGNTEIRGICVDADWLSGVRLVDGPHQHADLVLEVPSSATARVAPYAPKPAGPTFTPHSTPRSPSWKHSCDETMTAARNTTTDTGRRPSRRRKQCRRRRREPRQRVRVQRPGRAARARIHRAGRPRRRRCHQRHPRPPPRGPHLPAGGTRKPASANAPPGSRLPALS